MPPAIFHPSENGKTVRHISAAARERAPVPPTVKYSINPQPKKTAKKTYPKKLAIESPLSEHSGGYGFRLEQNNVFTVTGSFFSLSHTQRSLVMMSPRAD